MYVIRKLILDDVVHREPIIQISIWLFLCAICDVVLNFFFFGFHRHSEVNFCTKNQIRLVFFIFYFSIGRFLLVAEPFCGYDYGEQW